MLTLNLRPTPDEQTALVLHKRVQDLEQKLIQLQPLSSRGGWTSLMTTIREPYAGAWQRNDGIAFDTALSFAAVFACTTLIMSDTGKVAWRLVEEDDNGIWTPVENPAFSPVLRKPNRYQNSAQFKETWTASKLNSGNTYVLKQRDGRGVVIAEYVLDPSRVTPLVAQNGDIYYELKRDYLSGLSREVATVPASEIIHDRINCLFHPLMGLSPIYACALTASQGLAIQSNFSKLVSNGSIPGGILTAPTEITDEQAARLKEQWDANYTGDNVGKVAVLGNGLKYEGMAWNAVDLQLIEQLKLSAETVCTAYRVPPYIVDIGPPPPYANADPLIQKYYSQCLQAHFNQMELAEDEGIGLGRQFGNRYGTEFDPDDLIWLDLAARTKAATDAINGGLSFNEARKKFYGYGPVKGGDSPLAQQQYYSLEALAERDANQPFAKPAPTPAPTAPTDTTSTDAVTMANYMAAIHRKAIAEGLYAA